MRKKRAGKRLNTLGLLHFRKVGAATASKKITILRNDTTAGGKINQNNMKTINTTHRHNQRVKEKWLLKAVEIKKQ